jgi:hypothetical protein
MPISVSTYRIDGTKGKHYAGRSRLSAGLNSPGVASDALAGTVVGAGGKFAHRGCCEKKPFNGLLRSRQRAAADFTILECKIISYFCERVYSATFCLAHCGQILVLRPKWTVRGGNERPRVILHAAELSTSFRPAGSPLTLPEGFYLDRRACARQG